MKIYSWEFKIGNYCLFIFCTQKQSTACLWI